MLDSSNVIQTNQGSTGSSSGVASFNATLSTPATAGNGIIVIVAGMDAIVNPPTGYLSGVSASFDTAGTLIKGDFFVDQAAGGETSVTVPFDAGGPGAAAWWIAEVSGLFSMNAGVGSLGFPAATDYGTNGMQGTGSGFMDNFDSGGNTFTSRSGDEFVLGVAIALRGLGLGVPTISGTPTNASDGTAPAWARLGSTVVTSRTGPTATNVRLDVFDLFADGVSHDYNIHATWSDVTADALLCAVLALKAFWVPPQPTPGRSSTNSMT